MIAIVGFDVYRNMLDFVCESQEIRANRAALPVGYHGIEVAGIGFTWTSKFTNKKQAVIVDKVPCWLASEHNAEPPFDDEMPKLIGILDEKCKPLADFLTAQCGEQSCPNG